MRDWSSSRRFRRGAWAASALAALVMLMATTLTGFATSGIARGATCPGMTTTSGASTTACNAGTQIEGQRECGPFVASRPLAVEKERPDPDNVELNGSLKVSPALVELTQELDPGADLVCVLTLRSRAVQRTRYRITAVGLVGVDERERTVTYVEADDDNAASTASSWLEPAATSLEIDPREVVRVPVRVRVPAGAGSGGQYAGVAITPVGTAGAGAAAVGIEARVVIPFLMRVIGRTRTELRLRDTSAPLTVWNRSDWRYSARIANTGNVHATPKGRIRIRSVFGGTVATLPIEGRVLLPGGAAPTRLTWKGAPWFGVYRVDARLTPKGEDSPVVRDHRWLVALPPWWFVLAVMLILLLVISGSWARRHYERKWAREHHIDLDEDEDAHIELGPI